MTIIVWPSVTPAFLGRRVVVVIRWKPLSVFQHNAFRLRGSCLYGAHCAITRLAAAPGSILASAMASYQFGRQDQPFGCRGRAQLTTDDVRCQQPYRPPRPLPKRAYLLRHVMVTKLPRVPAGDLSGSRVMSVITALDPFDCRALKVAAGFPYRVPPGSGGNQAQQYCGKMASVACTIFCLYHGLIPGVGDPRHRSRVTNRGHRFARLWRTPAIVTSIETRRRICGYSL